MDLRTKLVFALVAASLVSMLALGWMAYAMTDDLLTDRAEDQLASLAEAKVDDLENVLEGWKDRVSLIGSRTQLRLTLDAYNTDPAPEHRERIRRILGDALAASRAVLSATVYGADGEPVLTVHRDGSAVSDSAPLEPTPWERLGGGVLFETVAVSEEGPPAVRFIAPLQIDGRTVGAIRVQVGTTDLIDLADDAIGLGEEGEIMVVFRDSSGSVRALTPLRSQPSTNAGGRVRVSGPNDPVELAFRGEEGPFTDPGLTDYRGQTVWAATRHLTETGWGVVVKSDVAEERTEFAEFRIQLVQVGFALSAFAILLGTLLGLRFAKPIHELAEVANRVREGELDARAEVRREDELGLLALTFNEMGDELERRMALLREFKKFFDLSPDMLCIAETDGYFRRVNPAFERILGWSEEELLERPFVDFVHPDDVEATIRETERLGEGLPTISFRNRYQCPDGQYRVLDWTCHPDPETGSLYAVARHVEDAEPDGASETDQG
jgi:PAS domain S-box-containing protein